MTRKATPSLRYSARLTQKKPIKARVTEAFENRRLRERKTKTLMRRKRPLPPPQPTKKRYIISSSSDETIYPAVQRVATVVKSRNKEAKAGQSTSTIKFSKPSSLPTLSIGITAMFITPLRKSSRLASDKDITPLALTQLVFPKKQKRGIHVQPTQLNITIITDDVSTAVTPTPTSASNVVATSIEKEKEYKGKATPGLRIKGSSKQNKTPVMMKKQQFYRNVLRPGVASTSRQVPSSSPIDFL